MLRTVLVPIAALLALAGCATVPPAETDAGFVGTVSAADPRAQEAGMAMLRRGGSATDAAIATMLALTVVEPQSSGIGGGGFMVRGAADGTVETFDGREKAPAGATPDWFLRPDGTVPPFGESVKSGLSVGVPGNIALAALAHEQHGRLPWATLFEPAIELAREGFRINPRLNGSLTSTAERAGWTETGRALFFDEAGQPQPAGHLVVNEELARTFEAIAAAGPEAFYEGPRAEALAATVAAETPHDGAMTAADLATYEAKEREAVCGTYRAYRICGMGPPSSGGIAVLQILGQLERFDLSALGAESPVTWHLFLESQRLAYADRELYIADSDFVSVPVQGLIDRDYLARRSALIDPDSTIEAVVAGVPAGASTALADGDEPEERGTSHFAVVDADDTMISYTSTIESAFGSGLMTGGFFLNNELTDFSRSPEVDGRPVVNRVEAGKRPRSSMAPMVVWDPQGRPVLAIGAAGGSTIPVQTARSIIGVIDFGLGTEAALGMPFVMAYGDGVTVEEGTWLEGAIPQLKALGHSEIAVREAGVKGNAVLRRGDRWIPARDPRVEAKLILP
ncbi:gamma-glutamyltransferase [Pelagerythrobacter aerophilus]|uniref:Glutathione hydrolase proenzyme n=1 Tax=Pelagerythrobacter aerophilus TaxID=2306995 RepID=A0A418NF00_9SPHN|nr:gamma-glutamyltransferase [Pelagerythrobacter aerophilus]RIV75967.1 gamma-glutamyltransferase [Pelagerythrobacter aerophilus]RIV80778.1 gamma-glutamyltransferase [Pelagerythrobacter aerophilus]